MAEGKVQAVSAKANLPSGRLSERKRAAGAKTNRHTQKALMEYLLLGRVDD